MLMMAPISEMRADTWSLSGDINSWSDASGSGYEFTEGSDGVYTLELETLSGSFKLRKDYAWDDQYGSNGSTINVSETYTLSAGGDNISITDNPELSGVTLTFTIGDSEATLLIEAESSGSIDYSQYSWSLCGEINSWDETDDTYDFTDNYDGTYTLTMESIDQTQFKLVADHSWDVNLGGDGSTAVTLGTAYELTASGGNLWMDGTYDDVLLYLDCTGTTPTLTVVYEPTVGISVTPVDPANEDTVETLVNLTFELSDEATVVDSRVSAMMIYNKGDKAYWTADEVYTEGTNLYITLSDTIDENYDVTVYLPKGLLINEEKNTINGDTVFYFTVGEYYTNIAFELTPAAGNVDSLSSFRLTYNTDTVYAVGATWNYYPYLIDSDGNTIKEWNMEGGDDSSTDGYVSYDWDNWAFGGYVLLNLESTITEEGTYTLVIPEGTFVYNDDASFSNVNAAFEAVYTIGESSENSEAGISNITVDGTETYDVYTISGMRVMSAADKGSIDSLPAGIYIINGKKAIVR